MFVLAEFPRFFSQTQPLAQSLACSLIGENYVYRVNDYNGQTYNSGVSNLDIDMYSGPLTMTVSNTQVGGLQNRVWYCATIQGTASLKARWYPI